MIARKILLLIAGGFLACSQGFYEKPEALRIEMLDAGQGVSFLIRGKNCDALYDAGAPESGIDALLRIRGVRELCSIFVSSMGDEYAGGLSKLESMAKSGDLRIGRVIFLGDLQRGDTIADFLPWTARVVLSSSIGSAFRISDGQNGFLFMGDLEEEQERSILEFEPLLTAYALQAGRHGSRNASSWGFLAQIQPKMALISAGAGNPYEYPHPETLAKLRLILPDSSQIFRTDHDGSVGIEWLYGIGMWRE